jgi:hypothetical protein
VRRFLIACPLLLLIAAPLWAADDTKKAADTRKKLQTPISVAYKDTLLRDVIDDLKEKVEGLTFLPDTKNGVNLNSKITYKADKKPVEEVLNGICDKADLGYFVISQKSNGYDGSVKVTRGKERGYAEGQEKPKTEDKPKEKPKVEDKPKEEKPKEKPTEDDPEKTAARKLKLAKQLLEDGKVEDAKDSLEAIIKKYKGTRAADEADELLKKLNK